MTKKIGPHEQKWLDWRKEMFDSINGKIDHLARIDKVDANYNVGDSVLRKLDHLLDVYLMVQGVTDYENDYEPVREVNVPVLPDKDAPIPEDMASWR